MAKGCRARIWQKFLLFLILVLTPFNLTGCWDMHDLENLSIPLLGGYDLGQGGPGGVASSDEVVVTTLSPNPDPEAPSKFIIDELSAPTVGFTRNQRAYTTNRTFIVGMLQVALFGEELAKQGIGSYIDSIYRSPQIHNAVVMAICAGRAAQMIDTQVPDSPNIGYYLRDLLRQANKGSFVPVTTMHEISEESNSTGKNPVLPLIKKGGKKIVIGGSGIFRKDKLIAIIGTRDTRSLTLLRGIKCRGYVPFAIREDGELVDKGTVQVSNKRKVRVERQGDVFTFKIEISLEGDLVEHQSKRLISNNKIMLAEIEQQVARDIERECRNFIRKMQEEFKLDCIDITPYALAKWRPELEKRVDQGFIENVGISVKVKVKLRNIGELN